MSDKQFFLETLKDEMPRFERVFKAVEETPDSKHSYKHDERSRTTLELMKHTFGVESDMLVAIVEGREVDFVKWPEPKWEKAEEIANVFINNMKTVEGLVAKMSEDDWQKKVSLLTNGKADWEDTKAKIVWGFLLDLVHHRGQLSTHLRPMGGKVPSIYGPSADSRG